ncbi:MAG: diguanylate cyclase [Kofleriaceae bacterium]|nr:diguanylate cyclase [Kofleriaceae bacterium]
MATVVVVEGETGASTDLVTAVSSSGVRALSVPSADDLFAHLDTTSLAAVVLPLDDDTAPVCARLSSILPPSVRLIALGDPRTIAEPTGEPPDCVVFGTVDDATLRKVLEGETRADAHKLLDELLGLTTFGDELPATLQELVTRVARAFDADDCLLILSEDSTCYTARQVADDVLVKLVPLCDTVCQFGTTLVAPPRPGRPYHAFLGVSLVHDSASTFAQLMLCREAPVPFDREARRHLRTLARRLSSDLSWRLVHDRLEADRDPARIDPVLGIANRLALQEELSARVAEAERTSAPFSVAIIDVDSLHLINERHGYPAGDAVLAHIARVASMHAGPKDIVARYAGDAVALALPGRTGADATTLVTKILSQIDADPVVHEGTTVNLTVSAGIAELRYEDDTGAAALGRAVSARQQAHVHGDVIALAGPSMTAETPAPHDFAIGSTLGGVYQIRHEISRGAFGVVYRAEDLALRRQVAVKLLRPDLARDIEFVERFRTEAATLARIRNPNLVQVYAFGIDGTNVYFAMELVEGQGLAEKIGSARRRRRHLPLAEVASVIDQVGEALEAVHRAGVLHRDVKPENVLIDRIHRRAVLVDVGIAIRRGDEKSPAGTPGFTAPEVFGTGIETPATDVYSLAVLAYLLLTLQAPFGDGDALATLAQQESPPPSVLTVRRDLPAGVDAVLMPALDPDPRRRPQSARGFAKALGAALAGPAGPTRRAKPRMTVEPPLPGQITVRNASLRGAPTVERTTRGILFRSAYEVLGTRRGNSWMADISRKHPELAHVLAQRASSLAWHPTATFVALLDSLGVDPVERNKLALLLGRAAVDASFSQFYGADPAASGPVAVLRATDNFWRSYHSWGAPKVSVREGYAEVTLTGGLVSSALCAATLGMLGAVVTHAGGQNVSVEHHVCIATGAHSCLFQIVWRGVKRPTSPHST